MITYTEDQTLTCSLVIIRLFYFIFSTDSEVTDVVKKKEASWESLC